MGDFLRGVTEFTSNLQGNGSRSTRAKVSRSSPPRENASSSTALQQPSPQTSDIFTAARIARKPSILRFLKSGTDVNARDTNQKTALHYTAEKGSRSSTSLLLNNGADSTLIDSEGYQPIHHAAKNANFGVVHRLTEAAGSPVDTPAKFNKKTPFYLATESKPKALNPEDRSKTSEKDTKMATMNHLFERGANLNAQDNQGYPPLAVMVSNGRPFTANWLREKGAQEPSSYPKDLWTKYVEGA